MCLKSWIRGRTDVVRSPRTVVSSTKVWCTREYVSAVPALDTKNALDLGVGVNRSRQAA